MCGCPHHKKERSITKISKLLEETVHGGEIIIILFTKSSPDPTVNLPRLNEIEIENTLEHILKVS